jgi:hypothetical protein
VNESVQDAEPPEDGPFVPNDELAHEELDNDLQSQIARDWTARGGDEIDRMAQELFMPEEVMGEKEARIPCTVSPIEHLPPAIPRLSTSPERPADQSASRENMAINDVEAAGTADPTSTVSLNVSLSDDCRQLTGLLQAPFQESTLEPMHIPIVSHPEEELNPSVVEEVDGGRQIRKRVRRDVALNRCYCDATVDPVAEAGQSIKCKQAGCETQWVSPQFYDT